MAAVKKTEIVCERCYTSVGEITDTIYTERNGYTEHRIAHKACACGIDSLDGSYCDECERGHCDKCERQDCFTCDLFADLEEEKAQNYTLREKIKRAEKKLVEFEKANTELTLKWEEYHQKRQELNTEIEKFNQAYHGCLSCLL